MNERDSIEKEERERQSLDDRLRAYYGPALQEQPLPSSSWLRLRSQLGSPRSPRRQVSTPPLWPLFPGLDKALFRLLPKDGVVLINEIKARGREAVPR